MVNLNGMRLNRIIKKTGISIESYNFFSICDDSESLIEYIEFVKSGKKSKEQLKEFYIQHEDKIDKEKLMILVIKDYQDEIEKLDDGISQLETLLVTFKEAIDSDDYIKIKKNISRLEQQKNEQLENLEEALKLGKDIDKYITKQRYNTEQKQYELEIISSKELIKKKTFSNDKNLRRFNQIDEELKELQREEEELDSLEVNDEELSGIECIIQSIVFTDYREIFPDKRFGESIRNILLDNEVLRQNLKKHEDLEKIKSKNYDEYLELLESMNLDDSLTEEKNTLKKYIEYVDIDKLLLIAAYRFEENLEEKMIKKESHGIVKKILKEIINNIKDDQNKYSINLQKQWDGSYDLIEVQYSAKDIKDCMNRFSKDSYLTKEYIEKTKQDVSLGKKDLEGINQEHVETIFNEQELEELANISDENFTYVSEKLKWENEKILNKIKSKNTCSDGLLNFLVVEDKVTAKDIFDLYMDNIIKINQILSVKYFIDFSEILSESDLNKFYQEKTLEKIPGEKAEKYTKYLSLYKEIIVKDKTRDQEEHSNNLMAEVIENYDSKNEEKHIQTVENYYKNGVLTLNSIIEWNDEKVVKRVITDLYNSKVLELKEITNLVKNKKLPYEYVKELVWKENASYETRKQIISEGWMPEDDILELYSKALIRKEDLKELAEKSLISKKKAEKAINNTSIKTLEGNALISLDIGNLQKIKRNESIYNTNSVAKNRDIPKRIIDPNKREELFDLFHACRIPPKEEGKEGLEVSKDSPFYNYRFYGITDENEKINLDSVIIAERIYEDEETQLKFALDNSTYFFKYRDLLLLSNYTKKGEAVKEMENMVFKANHTLATEEKNGHWGASVIYSIVKTMLSSNLKDLSKKEQRIKVIDMLMSVYTHDEIMEILDKSQEIDLGEHTYDIVDEVTTNHAENKGDSR